MSLLEVNDLWWVLPWFLPCYSKTLNWNTQKLCWYFSNAVGEFCIGLVYRLLVTGRFSGSEKVWTCLICFDCSDFLSNLRKRWVAEMFSFFLTIFFYSYYKQSCKEVLWIKAISLDLMELGWYYCCGTDKEAVSGFSVFVYFRGGSLGTPVLYQLLQFQHYRKLK